MAAISIFLTTNTNEREKMIDVLKEHLSIRITYFRTMSMPTVPSGDFRIELSASKNIYTKPSKN